MHVYDISFTQNCKKVNFISGMIIARLNLIKRPPPVAAVCCQGEAACACPLTSSWTSYPNIRRQTPAGFPGEYLNKKRNITH